MMPDLYGEDQDYPKEDWRQEVMNGDTLLGYWEWVRHQQEADDRLECEHGYVHGRGCQPCEFYERADYEYERSMDR